MTRLVTDMMFFAMGMHFAMASTGSRRRAPPPPGTWDAELEIIQKIPGLTAPGAHGAVIAFPTRKQKTERFPFVVFGHGCGGGYHLYQDYSEDLLYVARHGFIVVAPASCSVGKCGSAFPHDMFTTITECQRDKSLHPSLAWADFTRVGMYGHSLGASHAVLDARQAKNYSIKAVVAQHACNFINAKALQEVECPVMVTGGDLDDICGPDGQEEMYRNFTQEKALVIIKNAKHTNPTGRARSQQAQLELKLTMEWLRSYVRGEHGHTVHQEELCANPGVSVCKSTSKAPGLQRNATVIV